MSDVSDFLKQYNDTLRQELTGTDMPAELTERFTFDSCIKRQSGREVYFVTRKADGLRAVLRITDSKSGENAAAESAILKRLDHPAIPNTLGTWEYNGRSFLIREYFKGEDLHTYIRKHGALSHDMLIDITLQLCDILSYLHSQKPVVIHRDLKPENIIISGKDNVRLIDFGIARDFNDNSEKDTQIAGTRPYMAPEQFGSEQTDNRADIYSLGVVMIYLATVRTDKINLRTFYPYKELVPIIEKCIKKDRDQRTKTAARLKAKIQRVQNKTIQHILISFVVCSAITAALICGFFIGQDRGFESGYLIGQESGYKIGRDDGLIEGFDSGIASIMDVPVIANRPFTLEELYEPLTFDNWYIDMAIRNVLNKGQGDTIYRNEVVNRVDEIIAYGTLLLYRHYENELIKTHIDRGVVSYATTEGWAINERGDISSLEDITNAYSLRTLMLTSQSISDLSPLEGMKIERLNFSDNFIGNLLPIRGMVTLRELDLCQNPLRDLTPISRLLSLNYLDISHTQVVDLSPLVELTRLEVLNMAYTDVENLEVLQNHNNLRVVDVSYTRVKSLMPLVRINNPITVYCAGLPENVTNAVRNLSGITLIYDPPAGSQSNYP